MSDLNELSVAALRAMAKERGLKGVSSLRKQELISVLEGQNRNLDSDKDTEKITTEEKQGKKKQAATKRAENDGEARGTTSAQSQTEVVQTWNDQANGNERRQINNDQQNVNNRRQINNDQQNVNNRRQINNDQQNVNNRRQINNDQQNVNNRRQINNDQQNVNNRRQNMNYRQNNNEQQLGNDRRQINNYRQINNDQQNANDRRQNTNYYQNTNFRQNNYHQNPEEQQNVNDHRQNRRAPMSQERMDSLDSGEVAKGILDINQEGGYGFIRGENYLTCENDIYVANTQIRRFNLKTGDYLEGPIRVSQGNEKFQALLYISKINGENPENARKRIPFEKLTPIFANERLQLESPGCSNAMRMMNLFAPIGKGQRGMIVSPPKAGKTTLLKDVANAVKTNHPEVHIIILLIDERPEEVTDIKESIQGENVEVIHSTFDELPSHHVHVAEMVLDRGRRLVEQGQDCMILLDSITRLARACNLTEVASGRTLSGGLDPAALHMPKKFFGAARNIRDGGSLTILATALVDTGSRMDEVIFEEFKGTGNMEVVLDRKMSERRIFPAIDLMKSGTRRDDLLLNAAEQEAMTNIRRQLVVTVNPEETTERVLQTMERTKNNAELVEMLRHLKSKPVTNRNVATVMRDQNRTLK